MPAGDRLDGVAGVLVVPLVTGTLATQLTCTFTPSICADRVAVTTVVCGVVVGVVADGSNSV